MTIGSETVSLPDVDTDVFRQVFDVAPVPAALVARGGRFVRVNHALVELLGYPAAELLSLKLQDLGSPVDEPLHVELLDPSSRERCMIATDQRPVWVSIAKSELDDFFIVQFKDITERRRTERRLRRLADHDPLTWLFNRRSFLEGMHRELQRMLSVKESGALLLLDLDRLKEVNDSEGHAAGDKMLCTTADVLRRRLRVTDVIGRLGGDEFAAWLLAVTPAQADSVAADLARMLKRVQIEVSVGVATFDGQSAETEHELIAKADGAMYAHKLSRRS